MEALLKIKVQCPIALQWKIQESRLKEIKNRKGKFLFSETFEASRIPGVRYCLGMTPNEDQEGCEGETWIYLFISHSQKIVIDCDFNTVIESANFEISKNHVFEDAHGSGNKICTVDELFKAENEFIVDGEMTIKMNGTLMLEKEEPMKVENFGDHRDDLCLGLWKQENTKDFEIVVAGRKITAHKCVLATRSSVFAKMFESGLKETIENKVTIEDFTFEIVETAIKFCYHHSLVTQTSLEDRMLLLQFFDKYNIQSLKDDLEIYLISEIDESTVCRLSNASIISNALKLKKKCFEFLRKCLKKKPVADFEILDKDFALYLLQNAYYHLSE